jgi:hypothetical protein
MWGMTSRLLGSNGCYRMVDTFDVVAEDRLLARAVDEGLATVLSAVRRL